MLCTAHVGYGRIYDNINNLMKITVITHNITQQNIRL